MLKEGARRLGARGLRLRSTLLVVEVALSIVLLVGATLLLRSFARLTGVDPGFRPENRCSPSPSSCRQSGIPRINTALAFFDRLLERLRGTAGRPHGRHGADHPDPCGLSAVVLDPGAAAEPGRRSVRELSRGPAPVISQALTIPLLPRPPVHDRDAERHGWSR